MIIEEFNENQLGVLAQLLNDETKTVKKMFLSSRTDRADVFYIFYEEVEDQLNKEKEELTKLDKVAIELEKDKAYKDLKNETQRTIYILQKHDIPSSQAKKTIELVNMRAILTSRALGDIFERGIESGDIKIEGAKK